MRNAVITAAVCLAGGSAAHAQYATWLNEIDFDRLNAEVANVATGSNVPVTIVESGGYLNTADGRFGGKTLTMRSGAAGTSGHATIVGAMFFGNTTGFSQRSVAPAIANVDLYTYNWRSAYFLSPGTVAPLVSPNQSRVATHAYGETSDLSNLTRIDWVVEEDDFVQIVGSQLVSQHGNGFNSIAVAPTAGNTGSALNGTTATGTGNPYVAGRYRPDITGPHGTTSDSIGAVGGVAALLISRGRANPALSHHSYVDPRPGYTVYSAETSEVVKAAMMAGALRDTRNPISGQGNTVVGNITDYRSAGNQTANGLDKRFGAGMVNVFNSYKIIDAGEQDSLQDGGLGQGDGIKQFGFDYDPAFGGAAGSNTSATYAFKASANGKFSASLVWNLKVAGPQPPYNNFDSTATLYDLDLSLIDLTAGNVVVQSSLSTIDNTENLWADLIADHSYQMRVTTKSTGFVWDYGLAWQSTIPLTAVPEPATAFLLGGSGLMLLRRRAR